MAFANVLRSPSKRRQTRRQLKEAAALQAKQAAAAAETAHRDSIWEAQEYLKAFVKERWSAHWSLVNIDCAMTIDELHELGRLPKPEGTRECRRLVRVPVIGETVSIVLWESLAEELKTSEKGAAAAHGDERPKAGPLDQQAGTWRESGLSVPSHTEEKKRKRTENSGKGIHLKRRRGSEHSRKGKEKEAGQQPSKRTCVFCRHPSTLCCQIPDYLLIGQAVADQPYPDQTDHDIHERWQKLFPWVRRSSVPAEAAGHTTEEEPFWHKKEPTRSTSTPTTKKEAMACELLKHGSLVEKLFGKSNAMTIQKALDSFGERLAYGYGSRRRLCTKKQSCDTRPLLGDVL